MTPTQPLAFLCPFTEKRMSSLKADEGGEINSHSDAKWFLKFIPEATCDRTETVFSLNVCHYPAAVLRQSCHRGREERNLLDPQHLCVKRVQMEGMGTLSVNHNLTQIFQVRNVPSSMCENGCSVFDMLPILQRLSLVVCENGEKRRQTHTHLSTTLWLQALQYQGFVCACRFVHVCVCVCVSGTSASVGMAGCLSVGLLRRDQGYNKLAHYTP